MQGKPRIIQFRNGYSVYKYTFTLGQEYCIPRWKRDKDQRWVQCDQIVRFIQTTTKGFNLLNISTNRCVFKTTRLYDRRFVGADKHVPRNEHTFTVMVPAYLPVPTAHKVAQTAT